MRILVLTKRQYMGMDLLDDRFGRFRELPLELNRLGHEVVGLAISYRPRPMDTILDRDVGRDGNVTWHTENAIGGIVPHFGRVLRRGAQLVRSYKPEIIWAASDAYVATFGSWLAKRYGTCCVIDLYDNFEAFPASRLPGLVPLFRRAVRDTDGVTCFSQRMADHVIRTYPRVKPTVTIESGQRSDLFFPRERSVCRQRLGLPLDVRIIGNAGALDHSRGIEALFGAFERLRTKRGLHLAIAGPRKASLRIPGGTTVHDLRILPHEDVSTLINALDLAVICYRQSPQGEFSFPQKAYEIIACRVPLVAAAVGSMIELLADYPQCLYEPEDSESLAKAIEQQLDTNLIVNLQAPSWADSAEKLSSFFESVLRNYSADKLSVPEGWVAV